MTITEKIIQHIHNLPEKVQAKVLDYVESLELKTVKSDQAEKEFDWSNFSLSHAMQGMEDDSVNYSLEDLKKRFS